MVPGGGGKGPRLSGNGPMPLNAPLCEPRFPPPPPTAAPPMVSAADSVDMMLLVAERSERAERAEGELEREETERVELDRPTERAGE